MSFTERSCLLKIVAKLFHCETILLRYMLGLVQGITLIRKQKA